MKNKSSDKKNEELHIQILKEINGMKNPNRKWKRKKYQSKNEENYNKENNVCDKENNVQNNRSKTGEDFKRKTNNNYFTRQLFSFWTVIF